MFTLDDIEIEDDSAETGHLIDTVTYRHCPKDKRELHEAIQEEFSIQTAGKSNVCGFTVDLNCICTKSITDFSYLFSFCTLRAWTHHYNFNVSQWDTHNVTTMKAMFFQCYNFDCNLSKWNVSNVEDMTSMFSGCSSFNKPLKKWDISSLKKMSYMFSNCDSFNKSLRRWDIRNVQETDSIFAHCSHFVQPIYDWSPNWPHKSYVSTYKSRRQNQALIKKIDHELLEEIEYKNIEELYS